MPRLRPFLWSSLPIPAKTSSQVISTTHLNIMFSIETVDLLLSKMNGLPPMWPFSPSKLSLHWALHAPSWRWSLYQGSCWSPRFQQGHHFQLKLSLGPVGLQFSPRGSAVSWYFLKSTLISRSFSPPPCCGTDIFYLPTPAILSSSGLHARAGSSYSSFCSGSQLQAFQGLWKRCCQSESCPSTSPARRNAGVSWTFFPLRCFQILRRPVTCAEYKVMDRFAQKEQWFLSFCCLLRSQGSPFPRRTDRWSKKCCLNTGCSVRA